jgi:7-keto-8-aminopelargonate synthetase-like enzyme
MFTLQQCPGRTVFIDGREFLFFSGYSYLGMGGVAGFVELVREGIDKYGVLFPSSRISNTRLGVFEETEAFLSHLTSQQQTVIYSSGYLAGRAVAELLLNARAKSFSAPGTHAALSSQGERLNDDWQKRFVDLTEETNYPEYVLSADSLNPLTATINDFSFLNSISPDKKVLCFIDDSHGIGLLGEKGEGISSSLPKHANVEYVLTYSLSKAFHINGGAVSCSKKLAESLKRSPFYTASTSISPSLCHAFISGQNLYNNQRKKLKQNVASLQELVSELQNISYHPALPIFVLTNKFDDHYFTQHNVIISSFSYPDPAGKKINRIVLNALHLQKDLERLALIVREENGSVIPPS